MKHLKTIFACLLMAVLSIGQVWAEDVTISYTDIPDGFTATTGTSGSFFKTVSSANDLTINYSGINTKSSAGAADHAYGYAMFLKNYGYVYSGAAPDGYYPSNVVVTFGSNTGTSGKAGITYGSSSLNTRNSSVTGAVAKSGTCSLTNSDPTKTYWNFSTTGANVQVANIVVTYTSTGGTSTCATPTFSPAAGSVLSGTEVTISSTTEGATIYYTMGENPADPTASSTPYTTPISITENTTIKAIAIKDGYDNSSVATAEYTILSPLTTMDAIFSKATDVGSTATTVAITFNNWVVTGVKNSNAYVTDGTKGFIIYTSSHGFKVGDILSGTAVCKVQLYNGSAELTELPATKVTVNTGGSVDVNVLDADGIAALTGANTGSVIKISGECSEESSKYYIGGVQLYNSLYSFSVSAGTSYDCTGIYVLFNSTKEILPRSAADIVAQTSVANPTFNPAAGEYTAAQSVELSCATAGSTIYYTTDGSTPDNTSTAYSSAIEVAASMTIKAIAYKGEDHSEVATAVYTINIPLPSHDFQVTHTFTEEAAEVNFEGWTGSYAEHTFNFTNDNVVFAAGSKQTGTITDRPVVKNTAISLVLTNPTKKITAVRFDYVQWAAKTQTFTMTYSTDGGASYSAFDPAVTGSNFAIQALTLPEGVNAIRVIGSENNQAGLTSIAFDLADKPIVTKTVTITTPTNGTLVVMNGDDPINSGDEIAVGTTLTIVATPSEGYSLNEVTVNGAAYASATLELTENVTIAASFVEDVRPAAYLTLWENGNEVTFPGDHKQNDHVALPATVSHECANRVFMGWSAVEVEETNDKPSYLEPGADFVLSAEGENTLYAVYAAVATPAGYEKLASDEFETTATYVIGAEQASGNTTMWYFSSYSNTDVNINWGVMTDDPATTAPVVFTLSGTANALVAQDASGNYLTGLTTGKFKMSTTSTTITLSNAGIIGSTESYVLRHNYNGGNGGLRWYNGTTGTSAYFYKVIAAVYNKYSTTCDAAPATLVSIAISGDASVLEYTAGQHFDPTGLVVTGTYSDASSAPITEGIDWTFAPDPLTEGITSVSVTATVGEISSDAVVVNGLTVGAAPAPTSGNVVIIAEYDSKFYAMTNSLASGALAGVEVEKDGPKIVVASQDDKDAIQWTATVDGDNTTLKDANDKYIKGGSNASLSLEDDSYNWNWNAVKSCYISSAYTTRGLFFSNSGNVFKGYALTNLEATGYAAIEVIEIDPANIVISSKVNPELAYTPASDEITVGDAWSAPSLGYVEGFDGLASISYESSNEAVATVSDAGEIALAGGTGTATITATFGGNTNYLAGSATYTITVNAPAPVPTGTTYTKVTSTDDITDGEYLIVYEGDNDHASVAFDGALETLDAVGNGVAVTINEGEIAGNTEIDGAIFTIDVTAGTLQSASGKYIGVSSNDNGLKQTEDAETYSHNFSIDGDGNAVIAAAFEGSTMTLRYNNGTNYGLRFRYYKNNGQQAIALYKKDTPEPPTPTYTDIRKDLSAGNYYTVCWPKAMTAIKGGTLWSFAGKDASMAYLIQEDAPFEAGKPYIIYATAEKLEAVVSGDDKPAGSNNGLYGTLSYMNATDLSNAGATYMLKNNELHPIGTNNHLNANRAYVILANIEGGEPLHAPGRNIRKMPLQGQTATGCENIQAGEAPMKMMINGQIFILRGEKMYDTTGRLVK